MSARRSASLMPTVVFSNITGNRTMQEMLSLANEMAQRIAYDNRDWTDAEEDQRPITGDGVTTAFDLPADYKRMLLTSNVWRSTSTQHADDVRPRHRRVAEPARRELDRQPWGEWTMLGGQMHICAGAGGRRDRLLRLPRQELHRRWPAAASATRS